MKNGKSGMRTALALLALAAIAAPGWAGAAEKGHMEHKEGHGSMHGSSSGHESAHGGMMKTGDKVYAGKVGPFEGEARLVDMKAQMAKKGISEKQMAMMKNTHHFMIGLTDPGTKKGVTAAKGAVTVKGPDGKEARTELMAMGDHAGADITLSGPGKYRFTLEVEAGGKKGSASFEYEVK